MSASDLIRLAYEQGQRAGHRDRPLSKCPYAPHTQEEKWQAWMLGYESAAPRYVIAGATQ
jgi:ribosome modulation factor